MSPGSSSHSPAAMDSSGHGHSSRVLLVDDHVLLLEALGSLLSARGNVVVVGQVSDGREAVEQAVKLRPDVVLMDLSMPTLNGIEATRQIRKRAPGVRVLLLSSYGSEANVREAIRAGASGFVIKRSDVEELLLAITTVRRGNLYFSATLAESFPVDQIVFEARQPHAPSPREMLTPREMEVLQLVAEGMTEKEIAESLVISEKTVKHHKSNIMGKLGARNRLDLLRFAIEAGIVHVEHP